MSKHPRTVFEVEKSLPEQCVLLWVFTDAGDKLSLYLPLSEKMEIKLGEEVHPFTQKPTLRVEMAAAQQLLEELWRLGFRPEGYQHPDGQVAAMKEHIEDLRKFYYAGMADLAKS